MVHKLVLVALFTAVAPATASATATIMAQDTSAAAAPEAPEKKICRREVTTGSVMARVTCRTKAEWDAISARSRSDLERQAAQERARANVQNNR